MIRLPLRFIDMHVYIIRSLALFPTSTIYPSPGASTDSL